ncbi:MAG TPA: hypothetical protein VLQ93_19950 [Myxococcaceae bacterium]|nr:hypothetical protein [Myxococcaceae bacterium]
MSPTPDMSLLSAAELAEALRKLPNRQMGFLLGRLVRRRSLEACAAFYGITPEAFSVHLLRAGLALTEATALPCRPPIDEAEEVEWARALSEALEEETAKVPSPLVRTVKLCRRLRELGPQVEATLEAAEREEEESPKRRREELVRRLAILVLLALTAWLYLNRAEEAPEPPSRPPVPIQR